MSNDLLNTKTVNLTEIIWNGKKYEVPSFQRDYSWSEWEWEDLWLDMIEIYENKITHYMWVIVLQKKEDGIFFLIDWQQRITTLNIFIIAVIKYFDHLIEKWVNTKENELRSLFFRRTFIWDKWEYWSSSKLVLNKNNDYFYRHHLVNFKDNLNFYVKLTKSQKLLWDCYKFFENKIISYFWEKNEIKVDDFLSKFISKNLVFIEISVFDEISAYTIFETLNSRWVELTTSDLFKNFIFSRLSKLEFQYEIFEEKWNSFILIIDAWDISNFLSTYINSKYNYVHKKNLFKFLKNTFISEKLIVDLLIDLEKNIFIYKALDNPTDDLWKNYSGYKKIEKYIWEFNLYWIKIARSLLLAWYNNFNESEFEKILKFISIISFRYNVIWNKNPKIMEIEYNNVAVKISIRDLKNIKQVFEYLKNKLYVNNNEFKDIFRNKQINISSRKLLKYILISINNHLALENRDYNSDYATIEHILPQNPDISWEENFPEKNRESFISRLWNYILLEPNLNNQCENKSFEEKLKIYSKSKYIVTKEMINYYSETWWNTATIEKLQSFYAENAKDIWRLDL